ncbi:MAG: hypothetical protein AAFV93_16790 [Chloroflexota bacterium]
MFEPSLAGTFFYYAIPIRTVEAPHTLLGIMRVQMPISVLQDVILDNVSPSLHVMLVDEQGIRLLDNQLPETRFKSIYEFDPAERELLLNQYQLPAFPATQLSIPLPEIAPYMASTQEPTIISGTLHATGNHPEYIAVVPLHNTPFTLFVAQENDVFLQPIRRQTTGTWILSLVLTISAILVALSISRAQSSTGRTDSGSKTSTIRGFRCASEGLFQ